MTRFEIVVLSVFWLLFIMAMIGGAFYHDMYKYSAVPNTLTENYIIVEAEYTPPPNKKERMPKPGQVFLRSEVPVVFSDEVSATTFQYSPWQGSRLLKPFPQETKELMVLNWEKVNSLSAVVTVMFPDGYAHSFVTQAPSEKIHRPPDLVERNMLRQGLPVPQYLVYHWATNTPRDQGKLLFSVI